MVNELTEECGTSSDALSYKVHKGKLHDFYEDEAPPYRRGKLCCCDKEAFVHRFTIFIVLVDIAIFVIFTIMYFSWLLNKEIIDVTSMIYKEGVVSANE